MRRETVHDLAEERAERRAAKDFAGADELRDQIADVGWSVVDEPDGWRLEPIEIPAEDVRRPVAAHDVGSVLDEPATADVSIHWVVEGWPLDVRRAIDSFRANAGGRDVQYVVADVTEEPEATWGDDVEVLRLEPGTGWGAARNAGLKRRGAGSSWRWTARSRRPATSSDRSRPRSPIRPSACADRSAS